MSEQQDNLKTQENIESQEDNQNKQTSKEENLTKVTADDGTIYEIPSEAFKKVKGIGVSAFLNTNKGKIIKDNEIALSKKQYEYYKTLEEKEKEKSEQQAEKTEQEKEEPKKRANYEEVINKLTEETKKLKTEYNELLEKKEKEFTNYKLKTETMSAIEAFNPINASHIYSIIKDNIIIDEGKLAVVDDKGDIMINDETGQQLTIKEYIAKLKAGTMKPYFKAETLPGGDTGSVTRYGKGRNQINSTESALEALKSR